MTRSISLLSMTLLAGALAADPQVLTGRFELGRDLASFESSPPTAGTIYLLTGSASSVQIVTENPFVATVDFIEGEWKDDSTLMAHHVSLTFAGDEWAEIVAEKKPRQDYARVVYPHRKFQVAASLDGRNLRVRALTLLF